MYDELITVIRDLIPEARSNSQNYTASVLEKAADAIGSLQAQLKEEHNALIELQWEYQNLKSEYEL